MTRGRRLTCRRQPAGQTDAPATGMGQNRALIVADRQVWTPGCRRPSSPPAPPARLTSRRQPARQTVHLATAPGPNCASCDNERPFFASSCRRRHSLFARLSPETQFGPHVVAGCTVWPQVTACLGRTSPAAPRRLAPTGTKGHIPRQIPPLARSHGRGIVASALGTTACCPRASKDGIRVRSSGYNSSRAKGYP